MGENGERSTSGVSAAESLFVEYLARIEQGEQIDFGDFCARHSSLRDELLRLHSNHCALGAVSARAGARSDSPNAARELLARLRARWEGRWRYRVLGRLGRGGMSEVVEARDDELQRSVALKSLRTDLLERADTTFEAERLLSRFLAEAQITAQLDHPGVVAVHELCVDPQGQVHFAMARVDGRDFASVLERHRAGDASARAVRCIEILTRVCDTMAFAHSRGVVHRDLKPANVMVGQFGEVFVMDWGLARVVDAETLEDPSPAQAPQTVRFAAQGASALETLQGEPLGTLCYMAPEVLSGGGQRGTQAADIYAVGAMLYEFLSGAPPHADRLRRGNAEDPIALLRDEPPTPIELAAPRANAELQSICAKALERSLAARYASISALAEDLRAYSEDRVVRAHETGARAELWKWCRRNRGFALASAAAVVALALGAAGVAWSQSQARRALDWEADHYRAPYLESEARALWPPTPERCAAYERWLDAAERLAARLPEHRAELAALETRVAAGAALRAGPERMRLEALRRTVACAERVASAERSVINDVDARLEWARGVEELTLTRAATHWAAAVERVANPNGPYRGSTLSPRLGLIPLGSDPASHLEEFGHPYSGVLPERDPDSGRLTLGPESSLVFVLVPGGTALVGAQKSAADARRHWPIAPENESPVFEQELAPFFISKFELTRGQWLRMCERDSQFEADDELAPPDPADLTKPVTGVSWEVSTEVLARHAVTLPTEAQWEFAARAGADGQYFEDDDPTRLSGRANLADMAARRAGLPWPQLAGMEWLDDGFAGVAPVGSFGPNGFGLHDTIGNVWEWCLDVSSSYAAPRRAGDGLREVLEGAQRVARGGGYINDAKYARLSIRDALRSRRYDATSHGLRPCLPLSPDPARSP